MGSSSSPPPAPDPTATAAAQAKYNTQAAQQQQQMNMTNQVTPYGSLNYQQIGTWDDGTPRFEATQNLSPEQKQLYDTYTANQQKLGTLGGSQIDRVSNLLSTPWDMDTAVSDKLSGMQRQFLDPEWSTRESSLESKLANQGITPGSEAWNRQMERFSTDRGRAYNQMYLDAYKTGMQSSLTERNQPLNEITALMSGSQVQQPNFAQTPQASVAAPDYSGMVQSNYQGAQSNYNQEMAQYNAMMGGLFGLAGTGTKAAMPFMMG
jgi:hypothetical protein